MVWVAKYNPKIGDRFGRLVVCGEVHKDGRRRVVSVKCDCGNVVLKVVSNLYAASQGRSCGCLATEAKSRNGRKNRVHGHASNGLRSPTYLSWQSMHLRCNNPGTNSYSRYGGRGISVCDRWSGPDGFANFLSDMGVRPKGLTLDRADRDGNYEPGNCKWSTHDEQMANRHNARLVTVRGRTQTAAQWAREVGLDRSTVLDRLKRGATPEQAVSREPFFARRET